MTPAQIKKALNNIKVSLEVVDMAKAKKLLLGNKKNRPLKNKRVNIFASEMKAGHWACNGQSIVIDKNGRILDGQHRLEGVIESGETIVVVIARGVDAADFNTIDIGIARTNADFNALNGFANSRALSATIKNIYLYQSGYGRQMGGSGASLAFTPRMSDEVLDENPAIVASVEFAMNNWKGTQLPHSAIATLHYIFTQIDEKKGNEFMERLSKGNIAELSSPILKLRNFLYQRKAELKARGFKMKPAHQYGIVIKAWNAWIQGKTISDFDLKKGEEFPKAVSLKK